MSLFRPLLSLVVPMFALTVPLTPASATEDRRDMRTFKCSELVAAYSSGKKDDSDSGDILLTWMAGYHATDDQGTIIDFDGLKKDIVKTVEFCQGHPEVGVMSASEKFMGDNSTEITSEAVDLSTISCEHVVNKAQNATKDTEEGFAVILSWLSGYYASVNEDSVVDMNSFERDGTSIGQNCASDQAVALMTVAEKVMSKE